MLNLIYQKRHGNHTEIFIKKGSQYSSLLAKDIDFAIQFLHEFRLPVLPEYNSFYNNPL
jgi:hypothetical protein